MAERSRRLSQPAATAVPSRLTMTRVGRRHIQRFVRVRKRSNTVRTCYGRDADFSLFRDFRFRRPGKPKPTVSKSTFVRKHVVSELFPLVFSRKRQPKRNFKGSLVRGWEGGSYLNVRLSVRTSAVYSKSNKMVLKRL